MNRRLVTTAWTDLCGEERELAARVMAEAGQAAVWRLVQSGQLRLPESEALCFRAYAEEVARAGPVAERDLEANLEEGDLRAPAFCVAYDDERRRLLGLPVLPWHEPYLRDSIRAAELEYHAVLLVRGQHRLTPPGGSARRGPAGASLDAPPAALRSGRGGPRPRAVSAGSRAPDAGTEPARIRAHAPPRSATFTTSRPSRR